jgi:hypothetical protein
MLYIRTGPDGANYVCKLCDNTERLSNADGSPVVVTDTRLVDDELKYKRYVSPFLLHDATLPHVSNIVCPNDLCSKPEDEANNVVVVKYDYEKLRFLYMCVHCQKYWLNDRSIISDPQ